MLTLSEITRQLTANAEAMRALLQTVAEEQGQWKPDANSWSLKEVMSHMYNEERLDFRKHLKEMISDPPLPWGLFNEADLIHVNELREALEGFLTERQSSLAWLKTLEGADWQRSIEAPWGPLSVGDALASWVEHDYLHMRQLIEVFYAYYAAHAAPFSVQYAGDW